jgi:cytochrome o ubiquinol oxidase subunit 3
MSSIESIAEHDHHHYADQTDIFGFWVYIMSDCVLFSCLFATFIVLYHSTYNGFGMKQVTELPYVLAETLFLLASSFTYGMAILATYKDQVNRTITWLLITFVLGACFVGMEINEFHHIISIGHGPNTSGAMTGFFSLVGTHGFHVSMGLFWMLVMVFQLIKFKLTPTIKRRLTYLGLFWAFLDIVWIFVFSIVYLMGSING